MCTTAANSRCLQCCTDLQVCQVLLLLLPYPQNNSSKHNIAFISHSCRSGVSIPCTVQLQQSTVGNAVFSKASTKAGAIRSKKTPAAGMQRPLTCTYLGPKLGVAIQLVGLDIDILLRSLPSTTDLSSKVFGRQLHNCQAVFSIAGVPYLYTSLHLRILRSSRFARPSSTTPGILNWESGNEEDTDPLMNMISEHQLLPRLG